MHKFGFTFFARYPNRQGILRTRGRNIAFCTSKYHMQHENQKESVRNVYQERLQPRLFNTLHPFPMIEQKMPESTKKEKRVLNASSVFITFPNNG